MAEGQELGTHLCSHSMLPSTPDDFCHGVPSTPDDFCYGVPSTPDYFYHGLAPDSLFCEIGGDSHRGHASRYTDIQTSAWF